MVKFLAICLALLCFLTNVVAANLNTEIGQMLMFGFYGSKLNNKSPIIRAIKRYHLGGVILYQHNKATNGNKRNIKNPGQLKKLNARLQRASRIPLFIAIDEEGGKVNRLTKQLGFPTFPAPRALGKRNDLQYTHKIANHMARLLEDEGINVDFFPVVDLNTNPKNPIIGKLGRSFSANPDTVIQHSKIFINAFKKHHVLCTLKHFPGHGSSQQDSHKGFVDISNTWSQDELIPYRHFIQHNSCPLVMIGHLYNAKLDKQYPASLSKKVITDLLRKRLKFKGLVISDDMQMGALAKHYQLEYAIERAINAGTDILLFSQNSNHPRAPQYIDRIMRTINKLVKTGKIKRYRIKQAYKHILRVKRQWLHWPKQKENTHA